MINKGIGGVERNGSPQQLPEGRDGQGGEMGATRREWGKVELCHPGPCAELTFGRGLEPVPGDSEWASERNHNPDLPCLSLAAPCTFSIGHPAGLKAWCRYDAAHAAGPIRKGVLCAEQGRRRGAAWAPVASRATGQEKRNVKPCSVVLPLPMNDTHLPKPGRD